jgi:hypothetical protein
MLATHSLWLVKIHMGPTKSCGSHINLVGPMQGRQERVPARRIVRSYVLPTQKRASFLPGFVFCIFTVRNEFLIQERKFKTCWAWLKWFGLNEPGRVKIITRFYIYAKTQKFFILRFLSHSNPKRERGPVLFSGEFLAVVLSLPMLCFHFLSWNHGIMSLRRREWEGRSKKL